MFYLWLLLTFMLAALMYFVRWAIRSGQHIRRDETHVNPTPAEIAPNLSWGPARAIKWISISEFSSILARYSDLIVIDLRAEAELAPFPVPAALVVPVSPNELIGVLEEIPTERAVALCGASDLSIFMIATTPCKEGSVPLYVLKGDLYCSEVA